MIARLVLWDLNGSNTSLEEMRAYLRDESVDNFSKVKGLRLKLWVSDPERNVWGAFYLWESEEAMQQQLPARAKELIGKEPYVVDVFQLEASAEGVFDNPELARRGLAFE